MADASKVAEDGEQCGDQGGDDAPPENVDIHVTPLVKLVKVVVQTGEEQEEVLLNVYVCDSLPDGWHWGQAQTT